MKTKGKALTKQKKINKSVRKTYRLWRTIKSKKGSKRS